MKLNKAEKFVKSWVKLGRTRSAIREAIFDKLGTWNFPPEYKDALLSQFPNHENDWEPILGVDYHHDSLDKEEKYWRDEMDHVNADADTITMFGHSAEAEDAVFGPDATKNHEEECFICRGECKCEIVELPKLLKLPEPGTNDWEILVNNMRELEKYTPIILAAKEIIEANGKNFNEEFEKWKKKKGDN